MSITRTHTLTMFRDNADTNVLFSQEMKDGVTQFHMDKVNEDGTTRTLIELSDEGFKLLRNWADEADVNGYMAEIIVSGASDTYQLKIAPSRLYNGGLKFVKCLPGGKKVTVVVLDASQSKRFVTWLNRTKV